MKIKYYFVLLWLCSNCPNLFTFSFEQIHNIPLSHFQSQIYNNNMQKSLDFDYVFKYILIGDASVGKSTMLNRFINDSFIPDSNPTMGVQFSTKKVNINGQAIKIQIWDTAGQQSFRTITRAYYKNAIGIILVYDLSNQKTLNTIDEWLKEIHDNSNEKAEIIVVGNKVDLISRTVTSPKPQFSFFSTSAKTGANITKMFTSLTQTILNKINSGKIDVDGTSGIKKGNPNSNTIKLKNQFDESVNTPKRSCC